MPGTAYASATNTSTAITGTSQQGTSLDVQVSVTASGPGWPSGTVEVSDGSASCSASLTQAGNGSEGVGSCSLSGVYGGTYTLTASYGGSGQFSGSSTSDTVRVGNGGAPSFTADNPPLNGTGGQNYSYTFQASGPSVTYSLSGAPSWLSINPNTGTVSGTAPYSGGSFTYSVTARNNWGSVTAGPFTVRWGQSYHHRASVTTSLSCPSSVKTNTKGTCTLYVTNNGSGYASDVTAQIALPSQLQAKYCGSYSTWNWNWNSGCSISGNTAYENIGTLSQGQTKELSVVFTAKTGYNLWGWHRGYRWPVKVTGSASANNGYPFYGQNSSSTAYVTIIPQGWWA